MRAPSRALFLLIPVALIACDDGELAPVTTDTRVDVLAPDTLFTETVVDTTPIDTVPADTTPPVDTVPADTTPADTRDTTPADTTPADTTPADTTPADIADTRDTTVADTTPADTTPVDTGPQACPDPARETVITRSTIFRQENYAGAPNALKFETEMCSDAPDSAERAYRFTLAQSTEIYVETDCGWDCELVLTRDGCDDTNVMTCETSLGDEAFGQSYNAGTYHLFVEGDNPEDVGPYDLMVNIHQTGGQQQCVAQALDVMKAANCQDPTFGDPRYELNLTGQQLQPSDNDDFFIQDVGGCTHDGTHIGGAPDRVYSFTLPGPRSVDIDLAPDGWDAMLYVTGSPCGARSQTQDCSDGTFGSGESLSLDLAAGTWYIVVDGFGEETFSGNAWGPFDLSVLVFDDACNQ